MNAFNSSRLRNFISNYSISIILTLIVGAIITYIEFLPILQNLNGSQMQIPPYEIIVIRYMLYPFLISIVIFSVIVSVFTNLKFSRFISWGMGGLFFLFFLSLFLSAFSIYITYPNEGDVLSKDWLAFFFEVNLLVCSFWIISNLCTAYMFTAFGRRTSRDSKCYPNAQD